MIGRTHVVGLLAAFCVGLATGDPNNLFGRGKDKGLTAADAGAMQRLLDAVRISCQFDPGYSGLWNNGQVAIGSAAPSCTTRSPWRRATP